MGLKKTAALLHWTDWGRGWGRGTFMWLTLQELSWLLVTQWKVDLVGLFSRNVCLVEVALLQLNWLVGLVGGGGGGGRGWVGGRNVTHLAGAFLATCDPMEGRSSRTVFKEWVSSRSCSAPTVLIGLHLYKWLINLGIKELSQNGK